MIPSDPRPLAPATSDHFDGVRFFNPGRPATDRGLGDVLRWKLAGGAAAWPKSVSAAPVVPAPRVLPWRVTMVGHATLLIQLAGVNILTDPIWSIRAGPFGLLGPRRVSAPGIRFDDLPPIDAVLVSHNHYDHLDIATLRRLHARDAPLFVLPLGNDALVARGVRGARIAVGDWGDSVRVDATGDGVTTSGIDVALVPANHWSARGLRDRRKALWCGFVIRSGATTIYFAGDTGYGGGTIFRDVRHRHGAPDLAIIPIGAYAPRWFMAEQHVDPGEAVMIAHDLDAVRALGIHWGTFQLTDEPRDAPPSGLAAAVANAGRDPDWFPAAEIGRVYEEASAPRAGIQPGQLT